MVAGGLERDVVDHPVDPAHLVDDPAGDFAEDLVGQPGPVGRHGVAGIDRPDGNDMLVGPAVAHDPHRLDRQEHGKRLPDLAVPAGLAHLLEDDDVGLPQDAQPLGGHLAHDPDAKPGPGKGWR